MEHNELLFINTLEDLRLRIDSENAYTILGISGLLRKLLIDGSPLALLVNRKYRTKVDFEIAIDDNIKRFMEDKSISSVRYFVIDGLDPKKANLTKKVQRVQLQQFLSTPMILDEGKIYSVKDIVLYEANIMGGVHASDPEHFKEQLEKIVATFSFNDERSTLRQLQTIGRVVLKGMEPLSNQIKQNKY